MFKATMSLTVLCPGGNPRWPDEKVRKPHQLQNRATEASKGRKKAKWGGGPAFGGSDKNRRVKSSVSKC